MFSRSHSLSSSFVAKLGLRSASFSGETLQSGEANLLNLAGADANRQKQQVETKTSKPFSAFLLALPSQFAKICRDLYYVFTTE
jgi:hypothetical protein